MLRIEKAIVAVNDSRAALHAFTEALRLSLSYGFQLEAVCVGPSYQGDLSLVGVHDLERSLAEPCRTVLDEAVRMAKEAGAGLTTFAAEGNRLAAPPNGLYWDPEYHLERVTQCASRSGIPARWQRNVAGSGLCE